MKILTSGNVAKMYCLDWIDTYVSRHKTPVTILDLGCGEASNFLTLLKTYPTLHYTGIEPLKSSFDMAVKNLHGLNAKVLNIPAYNLDSKLNQQFDIVISFSALEHVYQRKLFLKSAYSCLKPGGSFLINYDSGHFKGNHELLLNTFGPLLAKVGYEKYYQSFVTEKEFHQLVNETGFIIKESKFFNSALKGIEKLVPPNNKKQYDEMWLEFATRLNSLGIEYTDALAAHFSTRNYILQRAS